jgi:two-component system CheB/CheR fusion protein
MEHPRFIVGIGGSAGGLAAYQELLTALPPRTGMAFVIVAHLLPTATSHLARILSRHTKMKVLIASMAMPVLINHVYVISPDTDILIDKYKFQVISPRSGRNRQIDVFLTSLADSMGTHAIGIILSGYDGDGTRGCEQIKAKGGITFAQDLSATVTDMPRHAAAAGSIDFVLPPKKIADELQRIATADMGKA